ncbi:hypothetical protein HMPREF0673_01749 [Leyella stercorea DSM 18206]|uniref:Uncharacterized protein n=1 Tax=Leyella stercorea DSM 18206 TaxID=1002367 RepID=G6AYN9_9BACT|nr:hypothetical protein HMPREF0673_01749 [Leyella stercorea DSM 18206]
MAWEDGSRICFSHTTYHYFIPNWGNISKLHHNEERLTVESTQ